MSTLDIIPHNLNSNLFNAEISLQERLSVSVDGHYDQHFEWHCRTYLGGGANGRCTLCIDVKTGFLFAIKKVLAMEVEFVFFFVFLHSSTI